MPVENKGFGELFGEAKNGLDHIQASMAGILPSFPGQNAAKYFDLAIGIDFHPTIWPPSPVFPVPHIGMVFDIMGAIMSVVAAVLPEPPPPPEAPEGEDPPSPPVTVLGVANAVVNALKPSVQVHGQWIANAGTSIQHLPGIVLHILPLVSPISASEMWMGSSTVLADGGPFSTQFHPALSCNMVGFPSLFRKNKPPKPKTALMAPTSMLLCITSGGKPVLVGGPPTIDLFQLMIKMAMKGLGKLWKKAGAKLQDAIDGIKPKNPRLGAVLQSAKCRMFGEPVDAATGRVYSTNTDFELPGPIPFEWTRTYYSDAEVNGPLGYNWHHSYNMGMYDMGNSLFTVRLSDGREIVMPALYHGELFFNRKEQLLWQKDEDGYYMTDAEKLVYRFNGPKNADGYAMISSIANVSGFSIKFTYNAWGRLTRITDSSERILVVENDELGHITRIYTETGDHEITLIAYEYDAAGNMVHNEDAAGAKKSFYYDGHLLVQLTNQSGMNFYWEYEGRGDEAKCIHTWGDGNVLEYWTQYEEGKTTTRNSLGHVTEYYHDAQSLIYKIIDANGGITHQVYNHFEELAVVVNPEGGSTQFHYNGYGKLAKLVNANGESTTFHYDDRLNITDISSPGGMSLSFAYDAQNRLTERTGVDGNTVVYHYEGPYLKYISDHRNRKFELFYDTQHNLVQIRFPNGLTRSWDYDRLGRVVASTDVRDNTTRYRYDDAGNLVMMKEPDGNQHEFAYDAAGNLVKASDSSHDVAFDYGPLGILTGRTQNGRSVRFGYDTELQLRTIANEGGEVYRFGLDALGQIVSEWGFDGMNRRYLRDGNGRVKKVLRPAEQWTAYEYDGIGNIVKEEHSDGSLTAYRYNKDSLLAEAFNEEMHIALQRDKTGRVVKEIQGGYEVTKTYDKEGNCIFSGSSLGAAIDAQYNDEGWLTGINSHGWESSFIRDASGLELHRQLSGGVSVQTEHDKLGRVVRRSIGAHNAEQNRTRYEWGKGNKLLKMINELTQAKTNFEYDPFDNLVSATYNEKGISETIYRVPDKIGNLFKTKERSDRIYGKGGQLLQDAQYNYYYDPEGNLALKEFRSNANHRAEDKTEYAKERNLKPEGSATGWAYEWAGNGMLKKVINPGGSEVIFSYDPLGRRVAKQYNGTVTRWVWDGNVPLHEWTYTGGFPPHSSVSDGGDVVEEKEPVENMITWVYETGSFVPCAKIIEGRQYSIVADYLGTPTHAYDATGEKVWERELDIYGAVRKETGEKGLVPQLYQGQYIDEETGLAYNRFRYYDNESGNYISQDPSGLFGGYRLYGYVKEPNSWIDPSGLMPWPNPVRSGHHLVYAGKANSVGLTHLGSYSDTPTYFFNEPYKPGAHERIHAAQKPYVGPRQGPWTGTQQELIDASKKGLHGLDDIKGDLRIPSTGEVLAKNVTPLQAFEKLEEWHKQKMQGHH